ncbi:hypothetical protein GGI43DRAFT_417381 [Trichoderma evansii]
MPDKKQIVIDRYYLVQACSLLLQKLGQACTCLCLLWYVHCALVESFILSVLMLLRLCINSAKSLDLLVERYSYQVSCVLAAPVASGVTGANVSPTLSDQRRAALPIMLRKSDT